MAHDVFVSYSSKDKPVADAIVAGLEQKGIRCWITPRDVTPGTSWGDAIVDAIEASRIMVVILSGNSNQSRQVVREVERAVANEVIIIPFRIENIDPSGAMAYFLSTEHWLDALTPPLEEHIEKLANTIQLFLSEGDRSIVEERLTEPKPHPGPSARRWWPMPLVAVLLSVVAVVAVGVALIPRLTGRAPSAAPTSPTVPASPTPIAPTRTPTPTPPPTFTVIGEYRTSRSANGLFVADSVLNLANGGDGFVRLSVSDPTNPRPIGSYQVDSMQAQEVVVADDVAYVVSGDHSRHLVIIQLGASGASTTFPPEGESLSGASSLYYVTVADGLAHLTGHNYWAILDIQDPMEPQELWTWEPPSNSGNPCNATVDGTTAYVGGGWTGLHVFDIANPETPELLGRFDTPHWAVDLAVADDVFYLTMGEGGLLTLDVSDRARPLLIDRLDLPGFASHLSAAGDTLYVTYNVIEDYAVLESGLIAVDVRDPEALAILATYDELNSASDVQAVGDAVFVTDEPRGVVILSLNPDG